MIYKRHLLISKWIWCTFIIFLVAFFFYYMLSKSVCFVNSKSWNMRGKCGKRHNENVNIRWRVHVFSWFINILLILNMLSSKKEEAWLKNHQFQLDLCGDELQMGDGGVHWTEIYRKDYIAFKIHKKKKEKNKYLSFIVYIIWLDAWKVTFYSCWLLVSCRFNVDVY